MAFLYINGSKRVAFFAGVVTARLKRKQDAIAKNRQTAQKKVESAKEKVEQLVLPKEGESEWDLKGKVRKRAF